MKKANLLLVIALLIILIPIIDRVVYGLSDPFVAHVVVPSYVLDNTGNLEKAVAYLEIAYHNVKEKAWIWQIATANLIKEGVFGAPLLLYTTGKVSGIDCKVLGYSPTIYFMFITLFLLIVYKIIKNMLDSKSTFYTLIATFGLLAGCIDFLDTYTFRHFIGFQYHAVALTMYLAFILLFLKFIDSSESTFKTIPPLIVLYAGMTLTHYRFPVLVLGNTVLYTALYVFLERMFKRLSYENISKKLSVGIILFGAILYFSPFYWYMLRYNGGNLLDFFFIFKYIGQIIRGHREVGEALSVENSVINSIMRYNIYFECILWFFTVVIMALLLIKYLDINKSHKKLPKLAFFLWGVGSTTVYNLTYFLSYHGLTGISLYETWIVAISIVSFLEVVYELSDQSKLKMLLVMCVFLGFSVSLLIGGCLNLYYSTEYPNFPDIPRYQADTSLPFIWSMITPKSPSVGVVVGSSFPVSAELYEQTAKYKLSLLQHIGFRTISEEVLYYNRYRNSSKFFNKLQQRNEFLLITQYEEQHGLSTDVFGRMSYLMSQDIAHIEKSNDSIYNSNLVKILITNKV